MKYIVYKTTNLINGYIYIGVHKTEDPNKFDGYLGCGVYINKSASYEKAKTCFQQAVKEFGPKNFKREILTIYNTPEEAYELEGLLVNEEFLARPDVYNMILGGNINYESGKKIYCYSADSGDFVKEYESCQKASEEIECDSSTISHSIKFRFKVKNFIFSDVKVKKMDLSLFNFKNLTKVYRYTKDGKFDKEFKSLNEAGKDSIDTTARYIQKASTLGYLVKDSYYFSFYKEESYDKARNKQIMNREVHQYNSSGKYLNSYNTQKEAELANQNCNITKAIKLRTLDDNGNYWSLEKLRYYNIPVKRIAKKVAKLDDSGNIIQTWNSSNECAKEVGVAVKNVLQGKYEYHKGYKYKYINN